MCERNELRSLSASCGPGSIRGQMTETRREGKTAMTCDRKMGGGRAGMTWCVQREKGNKKQQDCIHRSMAAAGVVPVPERMMLMLMFSLRKDAGTRDRREKRGWEQVCRWPLLSSQLFSQTWGAGSQKTTTTRFLVTSACKSYSYLSNNRSGTGTAKSTT